MNDITKLIQRRGRKSNKIVEAFKAVPTVKTDFEKFANEHGVSINTFRQLKRWSKHDPLPGKVLIRKDKELSKLVIWRDTSVVQPSTDEISKIENEIQTSFTKQCANFNKRFL